MKIGTKIRIKDKATMRVWECVGVTGEVIGPDPDGKNSDVVAVKLDNGSLLFEVAGVHVSHLEPLKN